MRLSSSSVLFSGLRTTAAFAAPVVHMTDLIGNSTRTALAGFCQRGVNVNQVDSR